MAVIDQFSRRIVGFAIHARDPSGIDIFRMFNSVVRFGSIILSQQDLALLMRQNYFLNPAHRLAPSFCSGAIT